MAGEATAFITEKLGRITTTHILFCATLTGQTHHANGILSKLAYLKIVCCRLLPQTYPLCGSKHHPSIMPRCNVQFGQNYLKMLCTSDHVCFHLQGQRMILSDCEVSGVTSVGGDNLSTKIDNISKWRSKSK